MSSLLSLHSLQELKLNRHLHTMLLLVRVLLCATLTWQLHRFSDFSYLYTNATLHHAVEVYLTIAVLHYIFILFKPSNAFIFFIAPIIDAIFATSLLFLLPDQAFVSIIIALSFAMACLSDLKIWVLTTLNIFYGVAAVIAGWYFDTLYAAALQPAHLISATIICLSYLSYFSRNQQQVSSTRKDNLAHHTLQKSQLTDALFYLLPYHQRNHTPLSLLVIRIQDKQYKKKAQLIQLIQIYKNRIRKSDFLIQINPQHLVILLSDTNSEQASKLVSSLKNKVEMSDVTIKPAHYAIVNFPLDQAIAIDQILYQSMQALKEAEQQQVNRVIFISAK